MEVSIRIEKPDTSPWPQWDDAQHENDMEFGDMVFELPHHTAPSNEDLVRPSSFDKWEAAIIERRWPNEQRYLELLRILATEPAYWINVIH
ncbi:hypothetical protein Hden_1194 [Hyphomicrobium denitrificans ATCC 51888]|uniref:Uncharacterized protein n=1 Tax=Hyphomicrobium denitrificans (strain ATCC 51888 / DSM 1869 / NCIMB 11706 / TK 0415) TaxID=582899 RepID=D8JVW8_HYPDA|nr:hypothetical protein [Hyphomicrobium denitrificans]ADJ23007.1 hypothetical protein Hden_1194 [Hyphomicrobium denitrificans ATCC 51888]